MTRAEIADALDESDPTGDALDAAAAELRKTCATCRFFDVMTEIPSDDLTDPPHKGMCGADVCMPYVPVDGSGFCHRWEAKP